MRSEILSGMRGEMFSRTEVSTPTEEEGEVRREAYTEVKEVIEEEGRREFSPGEEIGSSSGTGEKGNFKPVGLSAGRRETGESILSDWLFCNKEM